MVLDFGIKDFIDILLVAILLYNIYKIMKESGTINIFTGVMTFIALWFVVKHLLNMRLLGHILDSLMNVGVVILVILFQDEIRRFLLEIGSQKRWRFLLKFMIPSKQVINNRPYIVPLTMACINMGRNKVGALIVIQNDFSLSHYIKTGTLINADISMQLIENIFFKNSPLHDGAMIIADNRIVAASCILPVSHNNDIPKALGLRHRAALGLAQESDAYIVVVSEETGHISVAYKSKLHTNLSPKDLENILSTVE